jgi:aldehyde:ferredoxin oxidoreductase
MEMYGYTGKILHADLSTGQLTIEEPAESFYRRYLGGNGFVGYYLLKDVPKGADPLGPDNVLVMAGGTVTGVPVAGGGRSVVGCKSPLTGGYGEADGGGFFGAEMRRAGFDAVVVHGKAAKPVYLWIHDGKAEIRPAGHLWGTSTLECQEKVRAELGDKQVRLAMIGPGGEKLVRYACVINDLKHAAGRSGVGAVMGSKNLKAIAARGRTAVPVADPDALKELAKWMTEHWQEKASGLHDMGTDEGLLSLNEEGRLPTRNFQDGQFEGAGKISGEAMRDTILIDRGSCYACPIACKRVVEIKDADYQVDPIYGGPEYETIGAFGSNCGVDDLRAISKANELCNAYSVDTITTGMVVAFAMECYENGLLTKKDTGGLDLTFGNGKAMVELTRMICEREGLGDLLAEGTEIAARKLGAKAKDFAVNVKGQPFPMHECRTRHGQALGYAVSPTGADHMHNFWDGGMSKTPLPKDLLELGVYETVAQTDLSGQKVYAYTTVSNWQWLLNTVSVCMFIPWSRDQVVGLVKAIAGWQTNVWELLKAGERGVTMARIFNLREGMTRADDTLPKRMQAFHVTKTINEKPVTPQALDEAITQFYTLMGWDAKTGVPAVATLRELDIAWAQKHLAQ